MRIRRYIFLLSFTYAINLSAQDLFKNNRYEVSAATFLSTGDRLPFWLRANQYGEVPLESQILQLKGSMFHEYDSVFNREGKMNKFSWGYGITAVGNVGKVNQFLVSEAYVKVRHGIFEFYGGRRKEVVGLMDTTLTSGSYIWSGNALPLPKMEISIPHYTPILGKGLLSIKGSFSHGWFGSTDSVQNYYLHQKTLYVRLGRPSWKMKFYAGFNHQVQWGGEPTVPFYDSKTDQMISKFGSDFGTYMKVISGVSLNKDAVQEIDPTTGVPFNEAYNRAGNHLGTLDIALEYQLPKSKIMVYHQSIYEDGSLYYLSNIMDGLTGLSFKFKNSLGKVFKLNGLLFEYLNTTNQGGSRSSQNTISELRGRDNYFNNSLYKDGWIYEQKTVGTPFMTPIREIKYKDDLPENINPNYIINNMVQAINIALDCSINRIHLLAKYALSKNKGTYAYPLKNLKQTSLLLETQVPFNRFYFSLITAFDIGDLLPNNSGVSLQISKFL